ncbi:MAG TPA: hypothetical protein VF787_03305 [Thermoanaerobaculia bacterium]
MANQAQRSFAAGELSPALYGRTDVARYAVGLRTCRNFLIQREGGANYRPGFDFINETRADQVVRLIKFVFNNTQAYVLEFGPNYIRVYQSGALISSVLIATPYAAGDLATLRYVQQADTMTIVHPSYPVYELKRLSSTSWTFAAVAFGPQISPPQTLTLSGGTPTGIGAPYLWLVTAVDATTGEESLVSNPVLALLVEGEPNQNKPITLAWTAPATGTPGSYNVYRSRGGGGYGAYSFIGEATSLNFVDAGQVADTTKSPPIPFTGFQAAGDYPSVVGYYQQRLVLGGTNNAPNQIWCSQTGNYHNFNTSSPLQDDDAVIFALTNAEITTIRHILDLGKLIVGTEGAEWLIEGDANGVLTPSSINPRVGSYNGAAALAPVKIVNAILFVQALATRILELKANIYLGYYTFAGRDLTEYATHMFDGYTLVDFDYAQVPNYITWAVRSDGTLLGFTFNEDEQLMAWHRHDTDGAFENVCVIPEGNEHRAYVVVRRTINGQTKRYIERMRSLVLLDVVGQASFIDSALEYDGRDAGASGVQLTLSGSGFTFDDVLTLTASSAEFAASNVGDARFLRDAAGTEVKAKILAYTSPTVVNVQTDIDVPADMQNAPITDWDRAVARVAGLDHLEGKAVSIFADGFVVASPNNPGAETITVSGGQVILDQPYAHIRVGLPYLGDLETLDIDTPQGPSLKESNIAITRIGAWIQASRGLWYGRQAPADGTGTGSGSNKLFEQKIRTMNDDQSVAPSLTTDYVKMDIQGEWNSNGRVFLRQVDPLPLNVLAVIPFGFIPSPN